MSKNLILKGYQVVTFIRVVLTVCFAVSIGFESASAVPFSSGKSKQKVKKEKITLTEEEKRVLGTFEAKLSSCIGRKKEESDRKCLGQYPFVDKKKKSVLAAPAKKTFGTKAKISRDAKECMKYFETETSLKCVASVSKGTTPRVYSFWLSKNGSELDKLKDKQAKFKLAKQAGAATSSSGSSDEWVKEFE